MRGHEKPQAVKDCLRLIAKRDYTPETSARPKGRAHLINETVDQ
jgi:hypothetical protein